MNNNPIDKENKNNNKKRSCSLNDLLIERSKLKKTQSFESIKFESEIVNESIRKIKYFKQKSIHSPKNELNKLLADPEKFKLIQKGLELGLKVENIITCFKKVDTLDEEKFFEALIDISIKADCKSNDSQKDNFENDDLTNSYVTKDENNENSAETKLKNQLEIQKQKKSAKTIQSSNLRPIIIDGNDVATKYYIILF